MNILYLTSGQNENSLYNFLNHDGNQIIELKGPFEISLLKICQIDFIISYGYRYIIKQPIIDFIKGRIINLHISLLPWNRGADPNLWSWIDNTPKGVTIHFIDEGIDTGNIIVQKEIRFKGTEGMTLNSSYLFLKEEIEDLFMGNWASIKRGAFGQGTVQEGVRSFHTIKDMDKYRTCLTEGWQTKIDTFLTNIKKL